MRFLIVAVVLAYVAATPAPPVGQRLEPTAPTISAGDINGAAIDAQVEAGDAQVEVADTVRAAIDKDREVVDKVSEIQGQAINKADEQAWRAVDTVKTVEARLDGAVAGSAPIIAKNYVRGLITPGVNYAIPAAYASAPAPVPRATPAAPLIQAPIFPSTAPIPYPEASVIRTIVPDAALEASAPIAYSVPVQYGYPFGYSDPVFDSAYYGGYDQGFYSPQAYAMFLKK